MAELTLTLIVPSHVVEDAPPIRTGGTDDNPLFRLADVCRAMGLEQVSRVADRLDPDDVTSSTVIDSMGRTQSALFVTEAGLYTVLLRSDKPQAKPFRKWVTGEVIPSIRRHGQYPPPASGEDHIIRAARESQRVFAMIIETRQAQLQLAEKQAALEAQSTAAVKTAKAALECATGNLGYVSVLGFWRLRGQEIDSQTASRHGKALTALCIAAGTEVRKIHDARWGRVNTYPESVVAAYFAGLDNGKECGE